MKLDRKAFFKIHSWIGIKLSILFFIVCFSGTLATLSHEMDWLFIPEMRAEPQAELATKNQIVENLEARYPDGKIEFWAASREPYLCDIVYIYQDDQRYYVFANPYTGEVQGHATLTFQRFFRDLHYNLFIPFQVGHFTVLFFGFLLLISLVTGLLFYKKWYRKLWVLKTGKGPLVLFRSLHRLVGVWSVPFTILFSITGIWYFLERSNTADISDIANPRMPVVESTVADSTAFARITYTLDYNRAVSKAKEAIQGLEVKEVVPPQSMKSPIYLTGPSDVPLVRYRANRVYLDPENYSIIDVQRADQLGTIMWLNDIADPLHFGYWGGLITKFIWFFAGLGISGLVLSGIWISLKRKVKNRRKQQAQKLGAWKYVNWAVVLAMFGFMYYFLLARYSVSFTALTTITLGWTILGVLAWYIFDYQLHKAVDSALVKH